VRIPSGIGKAAALLLLGLVSGGLGLLALRAAERGRAAAMALSAELLAPLDSTAGGSSVPETALASKLGSATSIVTPVVRPERKASADSAAADSGEAAEPAESLPPLDPDIFPDWTTFELAVPQARRTGRPVLLAFSAYGCEQCEQLKHEVFRDEAAGVTLRSAVVPVAVADPLAGDSDQAREADELVRRFDVTSYPSLVLYFPASGRVKKLEGYHGREGTLRWVTEGALSRK